MLKLAVASGEADMADKKRAADHASAVIGAAPVPGSGMAAFGYDAFRGQLAAFRAEKERQAYERLVEQVALLGEFTDQEAARVVLAELLDDAPPSASDTLLAYFRQLIDAVEPAAIPYIARLTAKYVFDRQPRDPFFRRVGRALTAVDKDEVTSFEQLCDGARKVLVKYLAKAGWPAPGRDPIKLDVTAHPPNIHIVVRRGGADESGVFRGDGGLALRIIQNERLVEHPPDSGVGISIDVPVRPGCPMVRLIELFTLTRLPGQS